MSSPIFAGSSESPTITAPNTASTAVPVFPGQDQLAAELKIPNKEFSRAVEDFANALTQGSRSKSYNRLCARDEENCGLLGDYFAQKDRNKEAKAIRKRRTKAFRVTEKNVEQAQHFDFGVLVQGLRTDTEHKFIALAELSMKTTTCPRNLSAALSIEAEEYYPSATARTYSKQLLQHAIPCLTKDLNSYERVFLRQGLYSYYDGDKDAAREMLLKAKEAGHPLEKYRTLYWLGQIAQEKKTSAADNENWQQLLNEFPLSFYAIQASIKMNRDPITTITNHRVGGYKRAVEGNDELNQKIRWLEALFAYKKYNAVSKWASWIVREDDNLEVDVLHYLSTIKIASGLYRSNINTLFTFFKKNPAHLNQEGLRLLYPRPFFPLVQTASRGKIDSFLVLGLMRQESAFDPRAVSRTKAKGLMQIEPSTARRLASGGHRKLLNEKANTEMGVKYLVSLGARFQGKMELVMAAYNAGPMKVEEWLRRYPNQSDILLWNDLIPYMETRDYVVSILRNNYFYAKLYGPDESATGAKILTSELMDKILMK